MPVQPDKPSYIVTGRTKKLTIRPIDYDLIRSNMSMASKVVIFSRLHNIELDDARTVVRKMLDGEA